MRYVRTRPFGSVSPQTKAEMRAAQPLAKKALSAVWTQKEKSRARSPAKGEVRQKSKPSRGNGRRQRREEESGAALKSATGDIGCMPPLCNAVCLIKGLR
jgi:hypothetical protein